MDDETQQLIVPGSARSQQLDYIPGIWVLSHQDIVAFIMRAIRK